MQAVEQAVMDLPATFQIVGVALGLGLLVGLQRERAASRIAGIRTVPLITVFGAVCALIAQSLGGWVVAAGFLALAGVIVIGNVARMQDEEHSPGITTEVASLLMYALGAYLVVGHMAVAVAVGAGVAVLLQLKQPLHAFVRKIGDSDIKAIMQFALIALVILPVLPNRTMGPLEVFNPYKTWLFVVLIVGISLFGYVAYKLFAAQVGALLAGVLGGLISSTATTLSYARISATAPTLAGLSAMVIAIATAVMYVRVLILLSVLAPATLREAALPFGAMLGLFILCSLLLLAFNRGKNVKVPQQKNPTNLRSALIFAGIFVIVRFGVELGKRYFGSKGLFVVAALSGLVDMDAITISTAQMATSGEIDATTAWKMILVATMSNNVFKFLMTAGIANRRTTLWAGVVFGLSIVLGAALLVFF